MVACPDDAISIVESYHVEGGFWATAPHPLPARMPLEPRDAEGNLDEWNAIERAVLERRSVRNFEEAPVPEPLILRVLEAGRFAPSGGNCQPWQFVAVTDKALLGEMEEAVIGVLKGLLEVYEDDEQVKDVLIPRYEAQPNPGMYDPRLICGIEALVQRSVPVFLNAPAVILIACDDRSIGGREIPTGICGQNMNLVANSLGIKACWVGFSVMIEMIPVLKEKLGLKPPWIIISGLALGYPKFKQEGLVPRAFREVIWFRSGSGNLEQLQGPEE
jgi:nitroreductase